MSIRQHMWIYRVSLCLRIFGCIFHEESLMRFTRSMCGLWFSNSSSNNISCQEFLTRGDFTFNLIPAKEHHPLKPPLLLPFKFRPLLLPSVKVKRAPALFAHISWDLTSTWCHFPLLQNKGKKKSFLSPTIFLSVFFGLTRFPTYVIISSVDTEWKESVDF